MQDSFTESTWKRGWKDFRRIWESYVFIVISIACSIGTALIKRNVLWGIGLYCSVVAAVLIVEFAIAPVKQRNECRAQFQKKVVLTNKESLLRAIGTLSYKAQDLIWKLDDYNHFRAQNPRHSYSHEKTIDIDKAQKAYKRAVSEYQNEVLVAGEPFINILRNLDFKIEICVIAYDSSTSPHNSDKHPDYTQSIQDIKDVETNTITKINQLSR